MMLLTLAASGVVSANIASGGINSGDELYRGSSAFKSLMHQGNQQSSTTAVSDAVKEEDKETGLYYAKARYYDPDNPRFISEDAWEGDQMIAPSLHKYLYVYQNPTVYIDPTGHCAEPITFAICAAGVIAAGATVIDYVASDRRQRVREQMKPESAGGELLSNTVALTQSASNTLSFGYFDAVQQGGTQGAIEHTKENILPINATKNAYNEFTSPDGDPVLGGLNAAKALGQTAGLGLAVAGLKTPKTSTGPKSEVVVESASDLSPEVKKATGGGGADEVSALQRIGSNAKNNTHLNHKINLRGEVRTEYQRMIDDGASYKSMGPALAGAKDLKTGKTYYGTNHNTGLQPLTQSPRIPFKAIPDDVLNSYIKTKGAGSHAEVNALNSGLLNRQGAQQSDFVLEVINAGGSKSTRGNRIPRCPHCNYLTDGAEFPLEPKLKK